MRCLKSTKMMIFTSLLRVNMRFVMYVQYDLVMVKIQKYLQLLCYFVTVFVLKHVIFLGYFRKISNI